MDGGVIAKLLLPRKNSTGQNENIKREPNRTELCEQRSLLKSPLQVTASVDQIHGFRWSGPIVLVLHIVFAQSHHDIHKSSSEDVAFEETRISCSSIVIERVDYVSKNRATKRAARSWGSQAFQSCIPPSLDRPSKTLSVQFFQINQYAVV